MKLIIFCLIIYVCISIFDFNPIEVHNTKEPQYQVTVLGAVKESKTISLNPDAHVKDILNHIQLLDSAELGKLNLNQKITDDMVINIPKKQTKTACVSINYADLQQLMQLNGIGEKSAQAIIEYRNVTPFLLLEDLMKVKGIGESKYNKLKDQICL